MRLWLLHETQSVKLPSSVTRWPLAPGPELLLAMDAPSKDVGDEKVGDGNCWIPALPRGTRMGVGIPAGSWDSCWVLGWILGRCCNGCWDSCWVSGFLLGIQIPAGCLDSCWILGFQLGIGIPAVCWNSCWVFGFLLVAGIPAGSWDSGLTPHCRSGFPIFARLVEFPWAGHCSTSPVWVRGEWPQSPFLNPIPWISPFPISSLSRRSVAGR